MSKKLNKKTKKEIKGNVLAAVAITSLLLNMFFIIGLVMYNSTNKLDEGLFADAYKKYCVERYSENVNSSAEGAPDEEYDQATFNARCIQGDFEPYYTSAVEDYMRDLGY